MFLVTAAGDVRAMAATPFPLEADLQTLIERRPILLSDGTEGMRRYSLVGREIPVPDGATSSRWSLDLLYVDERGHLTFVEVKRAKNPELRREVVAQVLEYAANGYTRWKAETLRNWHEEVSKELDADPAARLAGDLGLPESDTDRFWTLAAEKLAAGAMRLIIVADSMPAELQAIIEFLNAQMRPAEFLGLELRPFSDGDCRVLAPRWIGNTARAIEQKRTSGQPTTTTASVGEWLAKDSVVASIRELAADLQHKGMSLDTRGQRLRIAVADQTFGYLDDRQFVLSLWMLRELLTESDRRDLVGMVEAAGFPIKVGKLNGEPTVEARSFDDSQRRRDFADLIVNIAVRVRAAVGDTDARSRGA
jgi:hypothetical protein